MGNTERIDLPKQFCWTRFGIEAGETVHEILVRKELERRANHGMFLWGIGNAVGPSIRELTQRDRRPKVIFSPIKSAARAADVRPAQVVAWTEAEDLWGSKFSIPANSLVTSRYNLATPKSHHYALVCFSNEPLLPLRSDQKIAVHQLRNLRTHRPIGMSQVTAVVERVLDGSDEVGVYDVAISAVLIEPYFIRLVKPTQRTKRSFVSEPLD